ncbi:MAG: hypothetical protein R3F02_05645 [Thiolinea sp.]
MIGWIAEAAGQVLLFALLMNLVQGGLVAVFALQWWLMRKLSAWFG